MAAAGEASADLEAAVPAAVGHPAAGRQEVQTERRESLEQQLTQLVEQLKKAFGERLVAAILYGSAAVGDWNEKSSDLNILCVLTQVSSRELGESEPIFRCVARAGQPSSIADERDEALTSSDCFPMEYHDMQAHRRVLFGEDLIAQIEIDRTFYRAQVEYELRAKQLRLRQKAAEVLGKPELLTKLMGDSLSTFCVLGRHGLTPEGPRAEMEEARHDCRSRENSGRSLRRVLCRSRCSRRRQTAGARQHCPII